MKFKARAILTNPVEVAVFAKAMKTEPGTIFVECPEKGFIGQNLLACRYGLSIPYLRIAKGATLWIEPTIPPDERWIYTGFADCGGGIVPGIADEMILQGSAGIWTIASTLTGIELTSGTTKVEISATGLKCTTPLGFTTLEFHTHAGPAGPRVSNT